MYSKINLVFRFRDLLMILPMLFDSSGFGSTTGTEKIDVRKRNEKVQVLQVGLSLQAFGNSPGACRRKTARALARKIAVACRALDCQG